MERRLLDLCMLPSVQVVREQSGNDGCRCANEGLISDEVNQEQTCKNAPQLHERIQRALVRRIPIMTIACLSKNDDTGVDHDENHNFDGNYDHFDGNYDNFDDHYEDFDENPHNFSANFEHFDDKYRVVFLTGSPQLQYQKENR